MRAGKVTESAGFPTSRVPSPLRSRLSLRVPAEGLGGERARAGGAVRAVLWPGGALTQRVTWGNGSENGRLIDIHRYILNILYLYIYIYVYGFGASSVFRVHGLLLAVKVDYRMNRLRLVWSSPVFTKK